MAGDTRLASFLELTTALFSFTFIQQTHGYYCRSDWCNYNEYCCGFDECCSYLTGYWYLWLLGGVMLFSFFMVCCWMRYRNINTRHDYKKLHDHPKGYILYGVTDYGEPIYVRQQPPEHLYGQSPIQTTHISTSARGNVPLHEEMQRQSLPVQPPPYDYTERRTPTAPPLNH